MTGKTGSLLLMAPEVFKGQPYNEKADVYSFAILLWNMLSLDVPYIEFLKDRSFETSVMENGMRPPVWGTWPEHVQSLLERGWAQDYNKRPSMKEICDMLQPEEEATPAAASISITKDKASFGGLWFLAWALPLLGTIIYFAWMEYENGHYQNFLFGSREL